MREKLTSCMILKEGTNFMACRRQNFDTALSNVKKEVFFYRSRCTEIEREMIEMSLQFISV